MRNESHFERWANLTEGAKLACFRGRVNLHLRQLQSVAKTDNRFGGALVKQLAPTDLESTFMFSLLLQIFTTHGGGCLGSHIDEERSKMRYVLRFAELVSH